MKIFISSFLFFLTSTTPGETSTRPALNRNFGGGASSVQVLGSDDTARAVVWLNDGKFAISGRTWSGSYNDFLVMRFHADGTRDASFGMNGRLSFSTGLGDALSHAITTDSEGRLVVAGRMWGFQDFDFGVARVTTNGNLDTTFSPPNGFRRIHFGGDEFARAIKVDNQQRIVIGGYSDAPGDTDFAVTRLLTDGTLDSSFNGSGMLTVAIGTATDIGSGLVIELDDKIVLSGTANISGRNQFAIIRVLTDGSLDNTFNGDGMANFAIGTVGSHSHAVVRDAQGRYLLGGRSRISGQHRFAVMRLTSAGNLDGSFGSGGVSTADINAGQPDIIRGLSLNSDGTLIAVGKTGSGGNGWDVALARYLTNGSLDTSFSTNGSNITPIESVREDQAFGVSQQEGKVLIAGRIRNSANYDVLLARYNPAGSLASSGFGDLAFDGDGFASVDVGSTSTDNAYAIGEDSDRRIVSIGQSNTSFGFTRHLANGTIDSTFSGDGRAIVSIGTDTVAGGLVDQNNRPVGVGGASNDFAVVRLTTGGNTDNTWDGDGRLTTDVGTATNDMARAVVEEANGKLVVVGSAGNDFGIVRYLTDGSLDGSFATGGKTTTDVGTSTTDVAYAVATQNDGAIVVAGDASGDLGLVRYLSNGVLDSTFSSDGRLTLNLGNTDTAYGVAIDDVGRIVSAGSTANDLFVTRHLSNGNLDTTFGTTGTTTVDLNSSSADAGRSIAVFRNGKILITGLAGTDFAWVRLTSTGALDRCFGRQGIGVLSMGTGGAYATALTWDERILVGGVTNNDFAVVRLWP